ncbi:hypothetical protein ACFHWD_04190 [Clostridium sp. MT-14]|uniref:hypothetical protein n=1 Tax=Clostridium sp. MT-14 TaxID=3348360 RepID=UPI0035F3CF7E
MENLNNFVDKDNLNKTLGTGSNISGNLESFFEKSGSIWLAGPTNSSASVKIYFNFINGGVVKIKQIKVTGSYDVPDSNNYQVSRIALSGINDDTTADILIPQSLGINSIINVSQNQQKKYNKFVLSLSGILKSNGYSISRTFTGIDIEGEVWGKYLIKQNDQYYSIKDNQLLELGIPTDDLQKQQWFNDYGVDDLKSVLLVPDSNGNKLIDSMNDKFEVRMMILS